MSRGLQHFKVFFALSKRPYFHRAYLVTVRKRMSIAVALNVYLMLLRLYRATGLENTQNKLNFPSSG